MCNQIVSCILGFILFHCDLEFSCCHNTFRLPFCSNCVSCWCVDFATCLFQDDKASEDIKIDDTDTKKEEEEEEKGSSKDEL